jgi:hypothetical protein
MRSTTVEFPTVQFSPASCLFIFFTSKYVSQYTALVSDALRLCYILNEEDQVLHPYNTTDKITFFRILIFTILDRG